MQCDVLITATGNGRVDLIGSDAGRKQEVENVVQAVPGVTAVYWRRPQPQELRRWVEDRVRLEGFMLCPRSGVPLKCHVRVTATADGRVTLTGVVLSEERIIQVQKVIRELLGVTGVQWRYPESQEIQPWVWTSLQAKGFLCPSPDTSGRPCLLGVRVTPEGVVELLGNLCGPMREATEASGAILGVKGVKTLRIIRQSHAVTEEDCHH
jgi:hypothetical protein